MKTRIAFLASLLMATACHHADTFMGTSTTGYHERLQAETRERRYFTLEKVLYHTIATFESEGLRRSYVDEYATKYKLNETEKADLLKRQLDEAAQYDVFFISHFASDKDVGKITKEAGAWRTALRRSECGTLVDPDMIETVNSTDSVVQYFHPYVTHWARTYRVKFRRAEGLNDLSLNMTGIVGDISFDWKRR